MSPRSKNAFCIGSFYACAYVFLLICMGVIHNYAFDCPILFLWFANLSTFYFCFSFSCSNENNSPVFLMLFLYFVPGFFCCYVNSNASWLVYNPYGCLSLFTFRTPGPLAFTNDISMSVGISILLTSSTTGNTSNPKRNLWRFAAALNGDILTSLCTPDSLRSAPYTPLPSISNCYISHTILIVMIDVEII